MICARVWSENMVLHGTGNERRISRWEREDLIDAMASHLRRNPDDMILRRSTVEHPFGTIKA